MYSNDYAGHVLDVMRGKAEHALHWLAYLLLWLAFCVQTRTVEKTLVPNVRRNHMARTTARVEFNQVLNDWSR